MEMKKLFSKIKDIQYKGIQFDEDKKPLFVIFNDNLTNSTLAVNIKGLSIQKIRDKLKQSRKDFKGGLI